MRMNRRESLLAVSGLATLAALPAHAAPLRPKAVLFDTFGTIVDWRGSIVAEGAAWGKARDLHIDWAKFADRWRAGYMPSMDKVRQGQLPWKKLDELHRMVLEDLLVEFGISLKHAVGADDRVIVTRDTRGVSQAQLALPLYG